MASGSCSNFHRSSLERSETGVLNHEGFGFGSLIGQAGVWIAGDEAVGGLSDEGNKAALRDAARRIPADILFAR